MYEQGSRFEFIINKIENETLYVSQIVSQNISDESNNQTSTFNSYDSNGAAKYIIIVVLVYGLSIVFFIGSQVRSKNQTNADIDGLNAEKVLRSMSNQIFEKEVLQKLNDKTMREKAWKIYVTDNKQKNLNNEEAIKEIERIENKIKMNELNSHPSLKRDLTRKWSEFKFKRTDSLLKSDLSDSELIYDTNNRKSFQTQASEPIKKFVKIEITEKISTV